MQTTQWFRQDYKWSNNFVSPKELEYMAFSGQYEDVHAIFKRIPEEDKREYLNKYILNQVVWGGIMKLRKLLAVHQERAAEKEKVFIQSCLNLFIEACQNKKTYPRELFQTILYWTDELVKLVLHEEAQYYITQALEMGCHRFPELHLQILSRMARIANDKGNLAEAHSILRDLVQRPYLIIDRKLIPEILYEFSQISLKTGDLNTYKDLLFRGLQYFYTDSTYRRIFVDKICITFRGFIYVLLQKGINRSDKILFFIHWLNFKLPDFGRVKLGIINRISYLLVMAYVYSSQYVRGRVHENAGNEQQNLHLHFPVQKKRQKLSNLFNKHILKRENFLITRAMGGIGDLLMMTPGIHALKKKYPSEEIYLAIPKQYFSVFEGNSEVKLLDIEQGDVNLSGYRKWFNFSDCPAARVESRSAPKVKKSRIDIFARALGITGIEFQVMDRRPRYHIFEEEKKFQQIFWQEQQLNGKTVIGVQLHSDESYRDYPHMKTLVRKLAEHHTVLVFDGKPIDGFNYKNVIKVDCFSLRKAFALVAGCDLIVAPDSSFVHLAGALDLPAIALFGPIDGKIRTRDYPKVDYLDARQHLGCVPCWRNESLPCKLTNMRQSICLMSIPVSEIIARVNGKLGIRAQLYEHYTGSFSFPEMEIEKSGKHL
ncbi:MAG: glycosyltransferase family 9 protein [bacterium]|nr:MAG: glycosyltransferase family 9 protein [bacterium]